MTHSANPLKTKTARLLHSFQSVELQPEHCNYNDETPALRDFGVAPSIATALIRWGERHDLVCRFENAAGISNNAYSWQPAFLVAAVEKHLELFGDAGRADIPQALLEYARNPRAGIPLQSKESAKAARR